MLRRSWWLLSLATACGTDKAVPIDATLDLDDAFGTGIDAAPDAPPVSMFPVLCTGMLTNEMRMGPDPFGGKLAVGTVVGITYGYDPALADEVPDDPKLFDHDMIAAPQASLTISVGNEPDRWVFQTDPAATSCRLTIVNGTMMGDPEDRLTFVCAGMTATPMVGTETAHEGQFSFSSTNINFLLTDTPPNGTPLGIDQVTRTFSFAGDGWTWTGELSGCP